MFFYPLSFTPSPRDVEEYLTKLLGVKLVKVEVKEINFDVYVIRLTANAKKVFDNKKFEKYVLFEVEKMLLPHGIKVDFKPVDWVPV